MLKSSDCVNPYFVQLPTTEATAKEQKHFVLYCYQSPLPLPKLKNDELYQIVIGQTVNP